MKISTRQRRSKPGQEVTFDYKDVDTLAEYLTEHGRIMPRRISRLNATQQRDLARQINRARTLALLPNGGHTD